MMLGIASKKYEQMNNGEKLIFFSQAEGQDYLRKITKDMDNKAKREFLDALARYPRSSEERISALWFASHQLCAGAFNNPSMWRTFVEVFKDVITLDDLLEPAPAQYFSIVAHGEKAARERNLPDILDFFKVCIERDLNKTVRSFENDVNNKLRSLVTTVECNLATTVAISQAPHYQPQPAPIVRMMDRQIQPQGNPSAPEAPAESATKKPKT